jgi:hypothetical protein
LLALARAELQVLLNLATKREGRRILVSALVSLVFLGFVADRFGQVFAVSPQIVDVAAGPGGLRALAGALLTPALLVVLWFGFGGGPRQLFELPQLELLLQSPRRAAVVLGATWLRFGLLVSLWCTVLAAPAAARVGAALGIEIGWLSTAVGCVCLTLPVLALIFAVQILLMRFFAGRVTRLLLTGLGALGSIAFSLLLIAGALADEEDTVRTILGALRGRALWPFVLDAPAALWAELAVGRPSLAALGRAALLLGGSAVLMVGLAGLYRVGYENAKVAVDPLLRFGRGRRWPAAPAWVIFRKEVAQLVHQPGQLIGLLFSALVIVVLAGGRFLAGPFGQELRLTETERQVFAMLALWLFAQLTIAPGCLLRIAVAEGAQWPLWIAAPVRTRSFLAGKLLATGILMAWPALVAATVGVLRFRAGPEALLGFGLIVPAGILWIASATALVGTIPPLMRPRVERNNLVTLVGVLLLMLLMQATAVPGLLAWNELCRLDEGRGLLRGLSTGEADLALVGAAWLVLGGLSVLALGASAIQVRRLRRPER